MVLHVSPVSGSMKLMYACMAWWSVGVSMKLMYACMAALVLSVKMSLEMI